MWVGLSGTPDTPCPASILSVVQTFPPRPVLVTPPTAPDEAVEGRPRRPWTPRLPIIEEDGRLSPPLPIEEVLKTHHRPFSQRFRSNPPRYTDRNAPPSYSFFDVTGPKGEKFEDLRNNKFIARRGGWKKLCIIGFLVLLILIALVVGVAVGVSQKKNNR